MKTVFPKRTSLIYQSIVAMLLAGCYSAEFYPVAGYPGMRDPGKVPIQLRLSPPEREYTELGTLVIRNYSGDLRDETFLAFLRSEIRKRGGHGGWVQDRRYHRQVHYQTQSTSARRPGAASVPGGEIASQVAVIRIVIYILADGGEASPGA